MKRRTFLSVLGVATITAPLVDCHNATPINKKLTQPLLLFNIADTTTIRNLGAAYLKQVPLESNRDKLENLILQRADGKNVSSTSADSSIMTFLQQKIQEDFKTGKTIVINGWVLSVTEARQCALFSLTKS